MASLKSRNGAYYAQWSDSSRTPRQKRHALGTRNSKTAARLLAQADDAYRLGRFDPWVDLLSSLDTRPAAPVSVSEAVEAYLDVKRRTGSAETLKSYGSVLRRLAQIVGGTVPLARLSAADVSPYVCDASVSASTQRQRLRVIRAFLRTQRKAGHLQSVVTDSLTPPREPAQVPRTVKRAHLDAVCQALEADYRTRREGIASGDTPRDRLAVGDLIWCVPLFRFTYFTGLRVSEIARLRWGHIDEAQGLIYIHEQKNGKAQTIPLNASAAAVLETVGRRTAADYVFTSPRSEDLTERSIQGFKNIVSTTFARYRDAAGLDSSLTFHGLRHGFATALAEAGMSAWVVKEACRHSSITISQRYVSLQNDHLKSQLDSVFG